MLSFSVRISLKPTTTIKNFLFAFSVTVSVIAACRADVTFAQQGNQGEVLDAVVENAPDAAVCQNMDSAPAQVKIKQVQVFHPPGVEKETLVGDGAKFKIEIENIGATAIRDLKFEIQVLGMAQHLVSPLQLPIIEVGKISYTSPVACMKGDSCSYLVHGGNTLRNLPKGGYRLVLSVLHRQVGGADYQVVADNQGRAPAWMVIRAKDPVWIAKAGSRQHATGRGEKNDPFLVYDAVEFDNLFYGPNSIPDYTTIKIKSGVYETRGTDNFWQSNNRRNTNLVKSGWKIVGDGIGQTTLKLVGVVPHMAGDVNMIQAKVLGSGHYADYAHHVEVRDLTLDANFKGNVPDESGLKGNIGNISLLGHDNKVIGVEAINFSTNVEHHECFAIALSGGSDRYGDLYDALVENSIVRKPAVPSDLSILPAASLSYITVGGAPAYRKLTADGFKHLPATSPFGLGFMYNAVIRGNSLEGPANPLRNQGYTMGGCRNCEMYDNTGRNLHVGIYQDTWMSGLAEGSNEVEYNVYYHDNVFTNVITGANYNFSTFSLNAASGLLRQVDRPIFERNTFSLIPVKFLPDITVGGVTLKNREIPGMVWNPGRLPSDSGWNLPWQNGITLGCGEKGAFDTANGDPDYCYKNIVIRNNIFKYEGTAPAIRGQRLVYPIMTFHANLMQIENNTFAKDFYNPVNQVIRMFGLLNDNYRFNTLSVTTDITKDIKGHENEYYLSGNRYDDGTNIPLPGQVNF